MGKQRRKAGQGSRLALAICLAGTVGARAELPQVYQVCADRGASSDERIAACTNILRSNLSNPHNLAVTFRNRGIAFGMKGDHDRALADFDQAIALEPSFAPGYNLRSIARRNKGDLDRALADADTAIRLDARFAPAWASRGAAYLRKSNLDHALADFNEALRLDPGLAAAHDGRGVVFLRKDDLDHALGDLDEAIWLDPKLASAHSNRGVVFSRRSRYDRAIAEYDRAIALKPDFAPALNNRAWAYRLQGVLDRALADADEAIRLDSGIRARVRHARPYFPRRASTRPRYRRFQSGDPVRSDHPEFVHRPWASLRRPGRARARHCRFQSLAGPACEERNRRPGAGYGARASCRPQRAGSFRPGQNRCCPTAIAVTTVTARDQCSPRCPPRFRRSRHRSHWQS